MFYQNIVDFQRDLRLWLGERGVALSVEEKAACVLARAICKSPKILILDDCLCCRGHEAENVILSALKKIMKRTGLIIISHRSSSANASG